MEIKIPYIIKKILKSLLIAGVSGIILLFFVVTGIYLWAKMAGPPPIEVPQSTVFYAQNGDIIGESNSGQRRYWVELENVSPYLIDATIAIEDQRFYKHIGFDFKRIAGAILADIKAMAKVQGASTISQQYARNLFLSHEKTWKRKLKEAFYTIRLEANYSKEAILEGYLNTIYYGHGTYGIEAASRYYFNKSASELELGEAAMLAGIPKGPNSFSPFVSWEKAKNRQELILREMAKHDFISSEEFIIATSEPIELVGEVNTLERNTAPYFQDVVRNQLKDELGIDEKTITLGGLRVYTTLDNEMQAIAEEAFEENFSDASFIQGAFVAMDPKTGYVKALIGGRDYHESPFNRVTQAKRHPGSTIKPILYYGALENGFTPATTFRSEVTTFSFDDGRKEYTPKNFNHRYADEDITMVKALALSDNVYAVKTHLYLGVDSLSNYAKKFGIESEMQEVPSLALGTSGVSVLEMTNAYSHFANGGKKVEPVFITKVTDQAGQVIYEYQAEEEQVLNKDLAFVMSHMMTSIFDQRLSDYAPVTGQSISERATRIYAGKSGSTDKDTWMIGFSPSLVAGVWTGYDKDKNITLPIERHYAKNIWVEFMEEALEGTPVQVFKPTKGVVGVGVNPDSGLLATEDCPVSRFTYFIKGTEPTQYCTEHIEDHDEIPDKNQSDEKRLPEKPWYRKFFDLFSNRNSLSV